MVELHRERKTQRGHNPPGEYGPCGANPTAKDQRVIRNRLPCPCENADIDDFKGRAGPTLITCPPGLLMNLKRELEKFSDLNILLAGSDYPSPRSTLGLRSKREPEDMCRDVVLVSDAQVFSVNCLEHPEVSGMEKLSQWKRRESEREYE